MTQTYFNKPIHFLLLALIFLNSCKGQVEPLAQNNNDNVQINTATGSAKLPKMLDMNNNATIGIGIQDKEGNIWLGSNGDGLYKYDGQSFIRFSTEQGLNSNVIYAILQDKLGTLWVGTQKGLNRFDGKAFISVPMVLTNHKTSVLTQANNTTPTDNAVSSMMQDKNAVIWLGTDDGVYCYDGINFTRFLDDSKLINKDNLALKGIFSILEAKNGNIWFAECADEGVSSYDGKSLSRIIPYAAIRRTDRIIEDKESHLWFATAFKGICKYDGKTFTPNIFKAKELDGSYNLIKDANGHLWFDTQDGLGYYDGKVLSILTEKDGTAVKAFIPVLLDKLGNLWFSSKGMKLYRYDGKAFVSFSE